MKLKLKYIILALAILGAFILCKIISFFLPVIIVCIVIYVVYSLHNRFKRAVCEIFSTKGEKK